MRSDLSKGTEEGCGRVEWWNARAGGMCLGKFLPLLPISSVSLENLTNTYDFFLLLGPESPSTQQTQLVNDVGVHIPQLLHPWAD